ncbi:hypothetical protein EDC94DRAFT_665518 [Helicostylum pulchrum]|nr:hypothetical protein EDC94DRAFT_665518 [Helicostylum pulchrum]
MQLWKPSNPVSRHQLLLDDIDKTYCLSQDRPKGSQLFKETEPKEPSCLRQKPFAATSRQQQQQQEPISKNNGKNTDIFTEEDEDEGEEVGIAGFRSLVFKARYDFFKYGAVPMKTARALNLKVSKHQPKTLAEALDVLSYELLSKEKNTAQTLALNEGDGPRITYVDNTLGINEQRYRYKAGRRIFIAVPDRNDGVDELRASVCKRKADLLVVKEHDKELVKMLDILDYLIMNFGPVSSKENEVTCYRKAAYIMDILFRNTPLDLVDGEHSSDATKDARNTNKKAEDDDDDKKDLIGRKIDLIIKGSEVEVSSSERKKSKTTINVIQQQRIKSIRTNSAMLHKLSELAGHENLFLLGMDWVGYVGSMICLSQVSDVHCAHIIGDLVLPLNINVLDMFKYTKLVMYVEAT